MLTSKTVDQATYKQEERLAEQLNSECTCPDEIDCDLGEHPEGAKRGGHVPVFVDDYDASAFFDQTSEEWVPYDRPRIAPPLVGTPTRNQTR